MFRGKSQALPQQREKPRRSGVVAGVSLVGAGMGCGLCEGEKMRPGCRRGLALDADTHVALWPQTQKSPAEARLLAGPRIRSGATQILSSLRSLMICVGCGGRI